MTKFITLMDENGDEVVINAELITKMKPMQNYRHLTAITFDSDNSVVVRAPISTLLKQLSN